MIGTVVGYQPMWCLLPLTAPRYFACPCLCCCLQVGALVLEACPPRGIIHLLETQHTQGDRLLVERLVAEEYVLDTCFYFEADRVECAKRLAGGAHVRREVLRFCLLRFCWAWPHAHCWLLPQLLIFSLIPITCLPACPAPPLLQACRCHSLTSPCCARCCLGRCCACRAPSSSHSCTQRSWSTSASCAASSPVP